MNTLLLLVVLASVLDTGYSLHCYGKHYTLKTKRVITCGKDQDRCYGGNGTIIENSQTKNLQQFGCTENSYCGTLCGEFEKALGRTIKNCIAGCCDSNLCNENVPSSSPSRMDAFTAIAIVTFAAIYFNKSY